MADNADKPVSDRYEELPPGCFPNCTTDCGRCKGDKDYRDGWAAGVNDRAKPLLTAEELARFIADGDPYSRGYRDGLRHGPYEPAKSVLDVFKDTLRAHTGMSEQAITRIADRLLINLAAAGWRFE